MLIFSLLFSELESVSASFNSKTFQNGGNSKTQIFSALNQDSSRIANFNSEGSTQPKLVPENSQLFLILSIPRGSDWQQKFVPGARAKADARKA